MLKNFQIDPVRDLLVPNVEFYQMGLSGPVQASIDAGEVDEEFKTLPSWAKFIANPGKAKGFFTRVLQAIFLGQHGYDELNVDFQTNIIKRDRNRVAMMFLPANARNELLEAAGDIAQEALPGFEVVVLCGSVKINGKKITNRNAERAVREIIEGGKSILILAAQMAQRSFSIPEITELYLAYDRGDNGATIQKMSRTLTPHDLDKVGRIFSLSFDPNRDDKFDSMLLETAQNYKARNNTKSLREAMNEVLKTVDIFRCYDTGAVRIDKDTYLEEAMSNNRISRVIGKIVDLTRLGPEALTALANGNNNYFRSEKQDKTMHGKTRDTVKTNTSSNTSKKTEKAAEKEIAKARGVVVTILENLDVIIYGTNSTILSDAMDVIEDDPEMSQCIEEEFGVCVETLAYLFRNGIIKQEFVELIYDRDE